MPVPDPARDSKRNVRKRERFYCAGVAAGAEASFGPKFLARYCTRTSTLSGGTFAPRSIIVCTVSFQSSRLLWALVRLVSLWQVWQYSVAMGLPSPSGAIPRGRLQERLPRARRPAWQAWPLEYSRQKSNPSARSSRPDIAPAYQSCRPGSARRGQPWCGSYLSSRPNPCGAWSDWSGGGNPGKTRWRSVCRRPRVEPQVAAPARLQREEALDPHPAQWR